MKNIYTSYDENLDMTFIIKDKYNNENLTLLSTEVVGFYFGEPNNEDTKDYTGKLEAIFDKE